MYCPCTKIFYAWWAGIQKAGEDLSRVANIISVTRFCRASLIYMWEEVSEGAVNSQTLIYILFASVLQDTSYLGKKAAHCDGTVCGCCPSLSHWAILFPKAQNSMTSITIISEKTCLSLLFQVWNTLDCPTSVIAFLFLFVLF